MDFFKQRHTIGEQAALHVMEQYAEHRDGPQYFDIHDSFAVHGKPPSASGLRAMIT
ncbi:hypothetical protein D3C80_1776310 [compost metagenome]